MIRTTIFIIKFLLFGALFIVSNDNLYLNNPADFSQFSSTYITWLDLMYSNMKTATGYVIQLEWMPDTNVNELILGLT